MRTFWTELSILKDFTALKSEGYFFWEIRDLQFVNRPTNQPINKSINQSAYDNEIE